MTAVLRCQGCRRRLKHPSSSGYGPVCAKKMRQSPPNSLTASQGPGLPPGLSRALTAAPVSACDGQTELPLEDQ